MNETQCCLCGPVKNCAPYLSKVLENTEKIGALFQKYHVFVFYDHSTDTSLEILRKYQKKHPDTFTLYQNPQPKYRFRTHNLAYARNVCLDFIRKNRFPYFIMMDFDDVNAKNTNTNILPKYFTREQDNWGALSFNTFPQYYDIWALSIYPFCFSYNHFHTTPNNNYHIIQRYISHKLRKVPPGELLPCISAFNGFAIYKTAAFQECEYDGTVRIDLIPKKKLLAHSVVAGSPVIFRDYGNVHGKYEDCEHRAFHVKAIQQNNAKIRISPEILFE
jgi:glycosyltransferase involved in cell wall biosynthesis